MNHVIFGADYQDLDDVALAMSAMPRLGIVGP